MGCKYEGFLGECDCGLHGCAFTDQERTAHIVKRFVGKGLDHHLRPDAGRVPDGNGDNRSCFQQSCSASLFPLIEPFNTIGLFEEKTIGRVFSPAHFVALRAVLTFQNRRQSEFYNSNEALYSSASTDSMENRGSWPVRPSCYYLSRSRRTFRSGLFPAQSR